MHVDARKASFRLNLTQRRINALGELSDHDDGLPEAARTARGTVDPKVVLELRRRPTASIVTYGQQVRRRLPPSPRSAPSIRRA